RGQSQRGSVRLPISQRVPGCQPGDDGRCGRTEPPGVWDRVRAPQPQPRYGDSQVSTSGPQRTVYEVGLVTGHIRYVTGPVIVDFHRQTSAPHQNLDGVPGSECQSQRIETGPEIGR